VRLTRRGGGFVFAASGLFLTAAIASVPALLYATGLLLGLVVLAGCFVRVGPRHIDVQRTFDPSVVDPGRVVTARVVVTNRSGLAGPAASWTDRMPRVVVGRPTGYLPGLPARSRVTAEYALSSTARGIHRIGPLQIELVDPFGLVRRRRSVGGSHPVTVLPQRYALGSSVRHARGASGTTRPIPQHVGMGEDDVIARPYVAGDSHNRLHWKATAHRGELMVRQAEHFVSPRATVALDLGEDVHDPRTLEWSVSSVASIVTLLAEGGHTVAVTSHDHAIDAAIDGAAGLREVLIDLAGCGVSRLPVARQHVEHELILVAGRMSADRLGAWIAAIPPGTRVRAMIAASTPSGVVDDLDRAGWVWARYGPRSTVPDVWTAIEEGRRVARPAP